MHLGRDGPRECPRLGSGRPEAQARMSIGEIFEDGEAVADDEAVRL
jgi:hypothetical protein